MSRFWVPKDPPVRSHISAHQRHDQIEVKIGITIHSYGTTT